MEKLSLNRAQLFLRNKYTVFTMDGTVRSPVCQQNNFRRATVHQLLMSMLHVRVLHVYRTYKGTFE